MLNPDSLPTVRYVTPHALEGYQRVGKNRRNNNGSPMQYLRGVAEHGTVCGEQSISKDKISGRPCLTYHVRDSDTIVVCCAPILKDQTLGKAVIITAYSTQTYFHGVSVGKKKGDHATPTVTAHD